MQKGKRPVTATATTGVGSDEEKRADGGTGHEHRQGTRSEAQ